MPFRAVNIRQDPDAAAFVRSMADGNATVPTVVIGGRVFVNLSSRQLRALLATEAPQLFPEPRQRRTGWRSGLLSRLSGRHRGNQER
ncbi:MAG: glutaredoxin family protein [Actinomycetota bacterium]|nr:glutaredoxin family protein [Actinomycetota bacterium]